MPGGNGPAAGLRRRMVVVVVVKVVMDGYMLSVLSRVGAEALARERGQDADVGQGTARVHPPILRRRMVWLGGGCVGVGGEGACI